MKSTCQRIQRVIRLPVSAPRETPSTGKCSFSIKGQSNVQSLERPINDDDLVAQFETPGRLQERHGPCSLRLGLLFCAVQLFGPRPDLVLLGLRYRNDLVEVQSPLTLSFDEAVGQLHTTTGSAAPPRTTLTLTLSGRSDFCTALREAFEVE